jgi:hypothetical protein
VNPEAARSVIILAPEVEDPDPHVIKVILALTNAPGRPEGHRYHIVASLREKKNFDVARMVGRDEVQLVLAGELIARVTAQTCRQSGLSVAYTELLDFGGDEIYFKHEPSLAGRTFGDALFAYADSAVIGLRFADGRIQLNPPMDTPVGRDDRVIAISADDDTIRLSSGPVPAVEAGAGAGAHADPGVERPRGDHRGRAGQLRGGGVHRAGGGGPAVHPRSTAELARAAGAHLSEPARLLSPGRHQRPRGA